MKTTITIPMHRDCLVSLVKMLLVARGGQRRVKWVSPETVVVLEFQEEICGVEEDIRRWLENRAKERREV